jgi:riboflavin synthase
MVFLLQYQKFEKKVFRYGLFPHTFKETNLSTIKKNDLVNIEIDILSKYVRNYFNAKK